MFFETKNVGRRSIRWFAYRLPSAIFVYHALPQAFHCLTSLKLCCAVARQPHGHLQLHIYVFRSNSRGLAPEERQIFLIYWVQKSNQNCPTECCLRNKNYFDSSNPLSQFYLKVEYFNLFFCGRHNNVPEQVLAEMVYFLNAPVFYHHRSPDQMLY